MASGISTPYCRCGEAAILQTSWTETNPGRRFFGCARFKTGGACDFFQWFDNPMPDRARAVILGLLRKRDRDVDEENTEQKNKHNVSGGWLLLLVVMVIGFVVGRCSCSCASDD